MLRRLHCETLLAAIVVATVSFAPGCGTPNTSERGAQEVQQLIYRVVEEPSPTDEQMERLVDVVMRRVEHLDVAGPSVERLGEERLLIQLTGVEDTQQAKDIIGQTAQLEIVERLCDNSTCTAYQDRPSGLTSGDMARAFPSQDQATDQPVLNFELNRDAAQRFAVMTQRIFSTNITNSPDQLAFVLDGEELVSAHVYSPIRDGDVIISADFTADEVRELAILFDAGPLPLDIEEVP